MGGRQRWSDNDRDKALALEVYLMERCSVCGTLPGDWRDPETGRMLERPRWQGDSHTCDGCRTLESVRRAIPDNRPGVRPILRAFKDVEITEDDDEERRWLVDGPEHRGGAFG